MTPPDPANETPPDSELAELPAPRRPWRRTTLVVLVARSDWLALARAVGASRTSRTRCAAVSRSDSATCGRGGFEPELSNHWVQGEGELSSKAIRYKRPLEARLVPSRSAAIEPARLGAGASARATRKARASCRPRRSSEGSCPRPSSGFVIGRCPTPSSELGLGAVKRRRVVSSRRGVAARAPLGARAARAALGLCCVQRGGTLEARFVP